MCIREKTASSTNGAGKHGFQRARMKLHLCLSPRTKTNCRWIEDLSIRPEIPKLLEEKVENTPRPVGTDNDFLYRTPVVQKIRSENDKWDLL